MTSNNGGSQQDEELAFWAWFFERISPISNYFTKVRRDVRDSPIGGLLDTAGQLLNDVSDTSHMMTQRAAELAYSAILRSPAYLIVTLLLASALIGWRAEDFEHQINGDVEIYLPDGANSTALLNEVRTQWSTDIVILYVQTDNAAEGAQHGVENITDANILNQISWFEGDDNNAGESGYGKGLDYNKEDRGSHTCNSPMTGCDGVVWILSPAQIIKEANSTNYRFSCAVERYGLPGSDGSCAISSQNPNEGYSIPQGDGAQERIDNYVDNSGELLSNFVKDTNNDGIWDTGVVIMGISFDMANTDITPRTDLKTGDEIRDHKAFIAYVKSLLSSDPAKENCELCAKMYDKTWTMDDERLDTIPPRRAVTVTGLTPVLHDVSDSIYDELRYTMLPISLGLVGLTMFILHRSWKVLVICGTPIAMSLAVTFGSTVIFDIMLTPMIISAGPILVGLGVDYSLHLTNRIEENRSEILKKMEEDAWASRRDGEEVIEPDPFDPQISLTANVRAVMTTGNAIFLSALTTIVGFSVLMWHSLVPIEPMRTVGKTLLIGISSTFIISMLMVPAWIELLRYRKGNSKNLFGSGVVDSSRRKRIGEEKAAEAKSMNRRERDSAIDTSDVFGTILGINSLLFYVVSTTIFTGSLYTFADLTSNGSLILGFTLSTTLTFSLLDDFWDSVGKVPLKATLLVILVSSAATIWGGMMFKEQLGKDITGSSDEVPPGLESYEALREYSIVFEGGQTNMFIVDATERGSQNETAPIRDLPILDAIENMQAMKIDNVENTTTISLVNILKAVHVDVEIGGLEIYDQSLWELIHDECWDESANPLRPDCWPYSVSSREDMVNIAFDTLSPEVRSMLMNSDDGEGETKTLVYVNQPYINLAVAGGLRETIDGHLDEGGCSTPLKCSALGIGGVSNSLLTGGLPVSLDINDGIHQAQSKTTIATMLILLLVMAFLFRSARLAIFTMTAVGVVVLWQPLLMWFYKVNVNVFTAMIGTLVFGIGVDDSIHIIDRIKDERETPAGIQKSVSRTGRTIFETTATTCTGLAAGLFVAIPGLQNFFVLMMLLLVLALLTSSILLPSLIVAYHELSHALRGKIGTWQDYDESGSVADASPVDAVVFD
ncbi:MAG: MMPL family transporter [Candidatus Thalassarchaeaceae archaeon]|nr:MMPL family transporter [Candidatus Thalassarchaeaceae archaeon]